MEYGEWTGPGSCGHPADCVEVATWTRSSACSPDHGTCVEVAPGVSGVAVRDSKDPEGAVLHFTDSEWNAFLAGVGAGQFSLMRLRGQASER